MSGFAEVQAASRNRWPEIIGALCGINGDVLTRKQKPCPFCGGKDRFRFDDKDGNGGFFCNQCGAGDGFTFIAKSKSIENKEAIKQVAEFLGMKRETSTIEQKSRDDVIKRTWEETSEVDESTAAGKYLRARGIKNLSSECLGSHPSLAYWHEKKNLGNYPALIGLIKKVGGKSVGVHRIYLTSDGKKADIRVGDERLGIKKMATLWEGAVKGAAIQIDPAGKTLGIAEGVETALYVRDALGIPVWSTIAAPFMGLVEIPDHVETVLIFADNDATDAGRIAACNLADRLIAAKKKVKVILPPTVGQDWLDAGNLTHDKVARARLYTPEERWKDPIDPSLSSVMPFDEWYLPEAARAYVLDVAHTLQCPLDYAGASFYSLLSSMVGSRCEIRPKRLANWGEVPNLWGALVGGASAMKTPTMEAIYSCLRRFEAREMAKYLESVEDYKKLKKSYEIKAERLKTEIRKSKDDQEREMLEERYAELKEPEPPKQKRYSVNTISMSKLLQIMATNPDGVLSYQDELIGVLESWEDPKRADERAFFLKCWKGTASHRDDTIGRGENMIQTVTLSLFGGITPKKMRRLLRNYQKTGSDGLFARLQLLVYPDAKISPRYIDSAENIEAKERVCDFLRVLDEVDYRELGARGEDGKRPYFRLDDEAQSIFEQWFVQHQRKLNTEERSLLNEHLGKYRKLLPTLALLIHLADQADLYARSSCTPKDVTVEALNKAVCLCEYFESHARRAYDLVTYDGTSTFEALKEKLTSGELTGEFTVRTLKRHAWAGLTDPKSLFPALDRLVDAGWLQVSEKEGRGRPTITYTVNPKARRDDDDDDK